MASMVKKQKFIIFFFSLINLIFLISSCYNHNKTTPTAKNGIVDLRDWDFEQDGILRLKGEWKFKWLENNPEFTLLDYDDSSWDTLQVPGFWNKKTNSKYGYCWLRLKVINISKLDNIGIYLRNSHRAYELYINGKKILQNGDPGTFREDTKHQRVSKTAVFPNNDEIIIIAWNIANYSDNYGGPSYSIIIGKIEDIKDNIWKEINIQIFIIGIILMMSLYHIILWHVRPKDISSLYFALFCVIIIIRIIVMNNYFSGLFPELDLYELSTKIEFLTIVFGWFFFQNFLRVLFPDEFSRKIYLIFLLINIFVASFVILTPSWIFIKILIPYDVLLIVICLWIIYSIFAAFRNKKNGSAITLFGFIFLFITVFNDIIFSNYVSITISMIQYGLVIFIFIQSIVLAFRFATTYKTAEYLSINLQKIVKKRTKQLERANREKTNFFINIAHETKTPLTLINNYLDQYIKKYGVNKEIKIIKENIDKIIKDIVDFLDLEKINKGKMIYDHHQIVNFSNILKNKTAMFYEAVKIKNINIEANIEDDIFIRIDPNGIDRIINNLLDNAIKYNKIKGNIFITLKTNDDQIILIIEDTGIGIDKEQFKKIYKPFYQVLHEKKNMQGIGIGLAIVKKIIDDINGEIRVKSELNKGTVFTIILNRYILKENDIVQDMIDYSLPKIVLKDEIKLDECIYDENKRSILFVEDNLEMLSYLIDSMKTNYNVFFAANGKEALKKLKIIPCPDIVISDIMMDVMDGYDFFNELYNMKEYYGIPFIFLTAKTTIDDKLKGLSKGAIDYITKPFIIEELLAKIDAIIRNHKINKKIISEKNKKNILEEVKKKIEENISVNFDNNCLKYEITQREKEIIRLLMKGKLNKEICSELHISYNTLRNHLSNIFKKCNSHNKVELFHILKRE